MCFVLKRLFFICFYFVFIYIWYFFRFFLFSNVIDCFYIYLIGGRYGVLYNSYVILKVLKIMNIIDKMI